MNTRPLWQWFLMALLVLWGLQLLFGLTFPGENVVMGLLALAAVVDWLIRK